MCGKDIGLESQKTWTWLLALLPISSMIPANSLTSITLRPSSVKLGSHSRLDSFESTCEITVSKSAEEGRLGVEGLRKKK